MILRYLFQCFCGGGGCAKRGQGIFASCPIFIEYPVEIVTDGGGGGRAFLPVLRYLLNTLQKQLLKNNIQGMRQKGGSHFCKLSANGIILFLIQDSPTKPKYFNERFYYKEISNIFIIFNLLNNSFIMNQSVSEHRDETSD